jgi:hypothetical protein
LGGGEEWGGVTAPGGRVQGAAKLIFQVKKKFSVPNKVFSQVKENLIDFLSS